MPDNVFNGVKSTHPNLTPERDQERDQRVQEKGESQLNSAFHSVREAWMKSMILLFSSLPFPVTLKGSPNFI